MTCEYCLHNDEADRKKTALKPGEQWRCPECYEVWIADMQGVWIKNR